MRKRRKKERNKEIVNFDHFRWLEGQKDVFITHPPAYELKMWLIYILLVIFSSILVLEDIMKIGMKQIEPASLDNIEKVYGIN